MQVLERQQLRKRTSAWKSGELASLQATTLTALSQRNSSGYSREFMREGVMAWAARDWPELLIGRDACGLAFEAHSLSASVEVTSDTVEGDYVWAFRGTRADGAGRVWETCVLVLGGRNHDLLTVRTGYAGEAVQLPPSVQPRFLRSLIEHLPFEDGGYPLATVPREVFSVAAFGNLQDHLVSRRRTLPILAVASDMLPRDVEAPWPDPGVLARALCGVAHVVNLGAIGVACLEESLGPSMAVHAGEARLFMPGLDTHSGPDRHQGFATPEATHSAARHVEAAAQVATHAWSTSASRRSEFDAHWAKAVGA